MVSGIIYLLKLSQIPLGSHVENERKGNKMLMSVSPSNLGLTYIFGSVVHFACRIKTPADPSVQITSAEYIQHEKNIFL